ncbi:MAG: peptidase M14, partial [Betaproteobacteria bacterium]
VEAWMKEHTGYPTVSGFHEFLYAPETPIKGDLTDYAYHQRGCLAYVIELWDIFHQIGIETMKPFVDHYTRLDRQHFLALAKWDREVNHSRIFRPWRKVLHPQLGEVEVGGLNPLVGISNPPFEQLAEICSTQSAAFLRVAALIPNLKIELISQQSIGPAHTKIELRIANVGYLATYGLPSAKQLPHSEPLRLAAQGPGLKLIAPAESPIEIGHLDGWGTGLYAGISIFAPWTRGNVHEKVVTLVVEGSGRLQAKVGSCRVGYQTLEIDV